MHAAFTASAPQDAVPVYLFTQESWEAGEADLSDVHRAFAEAQGFKAGAGQTVLLAGKDGALGGVLFGLGDGRDALGVAALSSGLPAGAYRVAGKPEEMSFASIAAGWADGAYRFDAYLKEKASPPTLALDAADDPDALSREAEAIRILRDMVNTPAGDMTPAAIHGEVSAMAEAFGATLEAVIGDELLKQNYPMVHAVGRAATQAPRMLELTWGDAKHPELAIVGKGVAFDSGGLNIKTGDFMRIMKKDMGGAAHAIALARLVMGANLPVHLKLYVPTVENAIAGNAFRPGDILNTRKGLTVEIDNTDAEGRLILADALARACEGAPDLIVDFATLTGAARVALGPDLAPFFTDDETVADGLASSAAASGDPLWRMPLWEPYLADLKSPIADLVNSGGRMAGSITAAMFLKQFVDRPAWVHFDVWAWRNGKYGRPAGAAACGLRAAWVMIEARFRE